MKLSTSSSTTPSKMAEETRSIAESSNGISTKSKRDIRDDYIISKATKYNSATYTEQLLFTVFLDDFPPK